MAMGIGIGMGISGAQQGPQLVTGWFLIEQGCAITLPTKPVTSLLTNVPYQTGDYVRTKISGPYVGKRILLSDFTTEEPQGSTFIDVEPGSPIYNACQV